MTLAAALIYWVIVAIWLTVLGTVVWFYLSNMRAFGATRLLLSVVAIDTVRNIVENVYFGLYFGSGYGLFTPQLASILGQPMLLIMPKVLNIVSGLLVMSILLLRWLPGAINERRHAEERTVTLSRMAAMDGMTGLFNRSHFLMLAETEFGRSQRYSHPLSLVLLDIDFFKSVNDQYGHDVGDRVIIAVASTLRAMARDIDLTARLGGEEFVVLLPETGLADAGVLAERLRVAVAVTSIPSVQGEIRVTASFGVAALEGSASLGEIMKHADMALYDAKQSGRNRVSLAGQEARVKAPVLLQVGVRGR